MIRLATGRAALFGAMLLAALVAFLPLRLVLDAAGLGDAGPGSAGLAARRAEGSIWSGSLADVSVAGLRLGDLGARLVPAALVAGRARVALASPVDAATAPFSGSLEAGRHLLGADHVTATLLAAGLFAPLPVTALDLDDVSVRFRDGACDRAEGRVRATVAGEVAGLPLAGVLGGAARCDGGRLMLPLTSPSGSERVDLAIAADGRYSAAVAATPPDAAAARRLEGFGFQPALGGRYRLTVEGRF